MDGVGDGVAAPNGFLLPPPFIQRIPTSISPSRLSTSFAASATLSSSPSRHGFQPYIIISSSNSSMSPTRQAPSPRPPPSEKLTPSPEQREIVDAVIAGNNVIVEACAGSGKTTTALFIIREWKSLKNTEAAVLTYSKSLASENGERFVREGVTCIVRTIHSMIGSVYIADCHTDCGLQYVFDNNASLRSTFRPLALLILDEVQDFTPLRFALLSKLIRDVTVLNAQSGMAPPQIVVVGDRKQTVFDFEGADARFLYLADLIFAPNGFSWVKKNLSTSYRLSPEMCDFFNKNIYGTSSQITVNIIPAPDRERKQPVNYWTGSQYECAKEIANNLIDKFRKGFLRPDDVIVLAVSTKGGKGGDDKKKWSPLQMFNKLLSEARIPTCILADDGMTADEALLRGKLLIVNFVRAKGLERRICIVFGFNLDYYTFAARTSPTDICTASMHVAASRGRDGLILIAEDLPQNRLPFIDENALRQAQQVSADGVRGYVICPSPCFGERGSPLRRQNPNQERVAVSPRQAVVASTSVLSSSQAADASTSVQARLVCPPTPSAAGATGSGEGSLILSSQEMGVLCDQQNLSEEMLECDDSEPTETYLVNDLLRAEAHVLSELCSALTLIPVIDSTTSTTAAAAMQRDELVSTISIERSSNIYIESVAEINGLALPAMLETLSRDCTLLSAVKRLPSHFSSFAFKSPTVVAALRIIKTNPFSKENGLPRSIENVALHINWFLELAALFRTTPSYLSPFVSYYENFAGSTFDWISKETALSVLTRLVNLIPRNDEGGTHYEAMLTRVQSGGATTLTGTNAYSSEIQGLIDVLTTDSLYEIKCIGGALADTHILQLALYAWLDEDDESSRRYFILNALSGEKIELIKTPAIARVAKELVRLKHLSKTRIDDDHFIRAAKFASTVTTSALVRAQFAAVTVLSVPVRSPTSSPDHRVIAKRGREVGLGGGSFEGGTGTMCVD